MSGIITSYLLRDYRPVILERAERFGGNSRGESWRGIDYSIGAAYFMEQEGGKIGSSLAFCLLVSHKDQERRLTALKLSGLNIVSRGGC